MCYKFKKQTTMKKLFSLFALTFFLAVSAFGQEEGRFGSYVTGTIAQSSYDTVAQSFSFPGGRLETMRVTVFSTVSPVNHPAKLSILSGDGPYGDMVHESLIEVPGLNKFYTPLELNVPNNAGFWSLWTGVSANIDSGLWGFDSLATEYSVDENFPPGTYTLMVTLDTNVYNQFGRRSITSVINCYLALNHCPPPRVDNPYPDGRHYQSQYLLQSPSDWQSDMAFEVVHRSGGTFVGGVSANDPYIRVIDGRLVLQDSFLGASVFITDVIGRQLSPIQVFGRDAIILPIGQVCVVTVMFQNQSFTRRLVRLQ